MDLYQTHDYAVLEVGLVEGVAGFAQFIEIDLAALQDHLDVASSVASNVALFGG